MGKSIQNAVALGISADTSSARRELRQMHTILRQVKDPAEGLQQTLRHLNRAFSDGEISSQQFSDAVAKAELRAAKQGETLSKLRAEYEKMVTQSREAAAAAENEARAKEVLARTESKLLRDSTNRASGLKTKDDIDKERQSVEEHRKALQKRLEVFKKEKQQREALASAAKSQANEEERLRRLSSIKRNAQKTKDDIDKERQSVEEHRKALQKRLEVFKKEKQQREALASAARKEAQAKRDALMAEGRSFVSQFQTEQDRANQQLREANRLRKQGAITSREYATAVKQIHIQNSAMARGFREAKVALATLVGPLVIATAAFDQLRDSIRLSAQLAASEAKFRVFIGSLEGAKNVLKEIRDLSSRSPVSFQGGQRAVTTMLQFGVASDVVVDRLQRIAEITAGDTQRMESLALAFAQSQAAGRLMGQELLQMVNAGFNPLKIISEQTGRSLVELKKDMENGAISSEMVAKAFVDATSEGGKFFGLLEEMSKTSFGRLVRLNSELEKLKTNFGDAILSQSGFLDGLNDELSRANKSLELLSGEVMQVKEALELVQSFKGTSFGVFFAGQLEDVDRILNSQKEAEQLSDRLNRGLIRRSQLTSEQLEAVAKLREEERNLLKVTQERFEKLKKLHEEELKRATPEQRKELSVEFQERVGAGFFSDEQVATISKYRKELERASREAAKAKRVNETFSDSWSDLKDGMIDLRYGENADRVRMLIEQSVDGERRRLEALVRSGVAYERVLDSANFLAQQQAVNQKVLEDRINLEEKLRDAEKEKAKEEKKRVDYFKEQKKNLDDQIAYQRDLLSLTKQEAEIRKLMREDELTRAQAEDLVAKQGALDKFNAVQSDAASGNAPKAIQAGSREAFSLQAKRQAEYVQTQIRLQQEQIRIASLQNTKLALHTPLLRRMADKPGVQQA